MFLLTAGGSAVAELAPLYDDREIVLDHDCCVGERGDCWSLDLTWGEGRVVETHVLCRASGVAGEIQHLTHELAAWATLTLLLGAGWWMPHRG
jgi:hypothetical protein